MAGLSAEERARNIYEAAENECLHGGHGAAGDCPCVECVVSRFAGVLAAREWAREAHGLMTAMSAVFWQDDSEAAVEWTRRIRALLTRAPEGVR